MWWIVVGVVVSVGIAQGVRFTFSGARIPAVLEDLAARHHLPALGSDDAGRVAAHLRLSGLTLAVVPVVAAVVLVAAPAWDLTRAHLVALLGCVVALGSFLPMTLVQALHAPFRYRRTPGEDRLPPLAPSSAGAMDPALRQAQRQVFLVLSLATVALIAVARETELRWWVFGSILACAPVAMLVSRLTRTVEDRDLGATTPASQVWEMHLRGEAVRSLHTCRNVVAAVPLALGAAAWWPDTAGVRLLVPLVPLLLAAAVPWAVGLRSRGTSPVG